MVEFATDACGQSSCRLGLFVLYWLAMPCVKSVSLDAWIPDHREVEEN
ncbi:hypothetical protein XFF6990_420037 [Xanthomonas citri pv. fuscans]|nr:hypothetical protein XFF6990_420037 [Xanthomonas citri pv. fuscans]